MFNDDWMRERGFLEEEITKAEEDNRRILNVIEDVLSKYFKNKEDLIEYIESFKNNTKDNKIDIHINSADEDRMKESLIIINLNLST